MHDDHEHISTSARLTWTWRAGGTSLTVRLPVGARHYPDAMPSRDRDAVRDAVRKSNTHCGFDHLHDDPGCHHVHNDNLPLELLAHASTVSDSTASYSPRSAWAASHRSPRRTLCTATTAHPMYREPDRFAAETGRRMDGEVHGDRGGVHTVWKGVGWTPEDFRSECWRDQERAGSSSAIRAHLRVPGEVETGELRYNSLRLHHVRPS